MSALHCDAPDAVPSQDETHQRMRDLLGATIMAVLAEQPGLIDFHDHCPQRDRSSGDSWRGLQTLCHVSALLASSGVPEPSPSAAAALLHAVDSAAAACGMHRRDERTGPGMTTASWTNPTGDLLELIIGVKVAVRAISAPFLPGSLSPMATTSPASPLSPPPRLMR